MSEESQLRYAAYLSSDYWKEVSESVKQRAGYRCQVCNSPHDLQAHHRSYAHRGREKEHLDDLTCLCRRCHDIFHGKNQMAEAPPKPAPAKQVELVSITEHNYKRLRCNKAPYHWMVDNGINPKKKGWAARAIGYQVPASWLRY